jgi:hypothetical protein
MGNRNLKPTAAIASVLLLGVGLAYSRSAQERSNESPAAQPSATTSAATAQRQMRQPESRAESPEARSVEPQVQSEVGKLEAINARACWRMRCRPFRQPERTDSAQQGRQECRSGRS